MRSTVAAQAREGAESARELDVEGDVHHGDDFDLVELGQRQDVVRPAHLEVLVQPIDDRRRAELRGPRVRA